MKANKADNENPVNGKKTIEEIQKEMHDKMSDMFDSLGIIFAFGKEQFQRQRKEGVTYVNGGSGLIIPKENVETFKKSFDCITGETLEEYEKYIPMDEYILHELCNHEAFYTCELEETIEAVRLIYPKCTFDDVYRIYCNNIKNNN